MRIRTIVPGCLLLLLALGCASTKVSPPQSHGRDDRIARPGRVLVYDFGAARSEVAADSHVAAQPQHPMTPEQMAAARKLGVEVAERLAKAIDQMGIPAERATGDEAPNLNDLVIRGTFVTLDEGSVAKRMTIGLGAGASHLSTVVEGYQMTERGLRKLGSGSVDAGGGKLPGAALPAAVAIATANPIGLIVTSAVKAGGEMSGKSTIEGRAQQTVDQIAERLRVRFREQGWIQ
ncbi:MAG: hypothetical protein DCC71_14850 [Proteobacteria bacterium]|nr:MAG: hypothetical protein DCC71_14850 [Pseudomonadota bacterium]